MQGPVPSVEKLFFKVQGIFRTGAAGAFALQDFFAEYRGPFGRLRIGQMVPDFTLQRSQPDYLVPLVERAGVVNALIPGAMTLARDIGAQLFLGSTASPLHLSAGIFNGSGANHARGEEGDFLATTRVTYTRRLSPGVKGAVGVSGAYRRPPEPMWGSSSAENTSSARMPAGGRNPSGRETMGGPGWVPGGPPGRGGLPRVLLPGRLCDLLQESGGALHGTAGNARSGSAG